MFNELEYIDQRISIYNKLIQKQEQKINNIRKTFGYEPLYELTILKKYQRKVKSLEVSKDRYVVYANN